MPPELSQWIPPAAIVAIMLYLRGRDLARLREDVRQDMKDLESRLRDDMKRLDERVARVEHSQANLEGLLEGLCKAITHRNVA